MSTGYYTALFAGLQLLDFASTLFALTLPGLSEGMPVAALALRLGWPGLLALKLVIVFAFYVLIDVRRRHLAAFALTYIFALICLWNVLQIASKLEALKVTGLALMVIGAAGIAVVRWIGERRRREQAEAWIRHIRDNGGEFKLTRRAS